LLKGFSLAFPDGPFCFTLFPLVYKVEIMALSNKFMRDTSFIEVLFVIVIGWMLVALWQRSLDNFTFNTIGLSRDSTVHTTVIAVVVTIIFVSFVFIFDSIFGGLLEDGVENALAPPEPIVVNGEG